MNKPDTPWKFASLVKASVLAVLASTALGTQAAGLGKLTVFSSLGQPLKAEVVLEATPEELNGAAARLASHAEFTAAGIEFMPVLGGLRLYFDRKPDGSHVLRLYTDAPINDPFLHFLLELNWPSGRVVREYTHLVDPPELTPAPRRPLPPPAATPPVPSQAPAVLPAGSARPATSAASPAGTGSIAVKEGDTLSKIAREHKPESVSLDQMLVALFNLNRDEFDAGNMNRLRAGKILRLPGPEASAAIDAGTARRLVVVQAADFEAYRQRLAARTTALPAADSPSRQEVSGKIATEIDTRTPPPPVRDKLEVSRTDGAGKKDGDALRRGLEEDLIARDKALREATERIAQLEKNIENLKKLVEIKSQTGADLQSQAQAAPQTPPKPPAEPAATPPPAAKPDPAPAEKPAAQPSAPPPPTPAPAAPVAAEPGFIDENPQLVLGGGGIIALLLAYLGYAAWRRKKGTQHKTLAETLASEAPQRPEAPAVVISAADADVSIQSDFSEDGALTAEENVDPVAEADVLMAYGRDQQAEEILREGLRSDPTRAAIHLKLLELHANRREGERFLSVAEDLHALTQGQGPEWDRAVQMAARLGVAAAIFGTTAQQLQASAAPVPTGQAAATPGAAEIAPVAQAPEIVQAESPAPLPLQSEQADEPAAIEIDAHSLDFDLDLGTTSEAAPLAADLPVEAPATDEVMSLDFDFDLGVPEQPATNEPAPPALTEVSRPADTASIDLMPIAATDERPATGPDGFSNVDIDLGLDLGEPPVDGGETAEDVGELAKAGLNEEAFHVDFDLELDAPAAKESTVLPPATAEQAPPAPPPPSPATPLALELPDISLDLDEGAPHALENQPTPQELPGASPDLDLDLDLALDLEPDAAAAASPVSADALEPDNPEVATKLELAQAYEEMGDREGARDLLNEVLAEGNAAQRTEAQTRLDSMSA